MKPTGILKTPKTSNDLWMRVAAAACYIFAFGGLMNALGLFVTSATSATAGALAAAAPAILIGAGIGLLAAIGSSYINGKMEAAKEKAQAASAAEKEKTPAI